MSSLIRFPFTQVDVFTRQALKGNPVAVVHGADGLSDAQLQAFAHWTNLSETTFLLQPTDPAADYRLRIFTPQTEFEFAGHPTLGSCHAWLQAGGQPRQTGRVVQQCGVGLVEIAQEGDRLAFAAPASRREAVQVDAVGAAIRALGGTAEQVVRAQWLNNGSSWWLTLMLRHASEVLALAPDMGALAAMGQGAGNGKGFGGKLPRQFGVIGPHEPHGEAAFEVRAFGPAAGFNEDPVTGSLNASLGQWLTAEGLAPDRYVVSQGTAMGRAGRVHIDCRDGRLWVGGHSVTCVEGTLSL